MDVDRCRELFQTWQKHKLRTFLTAFGVFWGVFMLVMLMGGGNGLYNGVTSNWNVAKNTVFVWPQATTVPYRGFQPGRAIHFTDTDLEDIRREIKEVRVVAPKNQLEGRAVLKHGREEASFEVNGEVPEILQVLPVKQLSGRFLNQTDILQKRKVTVIGSRVSEVLFGLGNSPVGKYISINGVWFMVIGTFESYSVGEEGANQEQTVFIPRTTLQHCFNQPNRVRMFALLPQPEVKAAEVERKVCHLLKRKHQVAPDDFGSLGTANIEEEFSQFQKLFNGIYLFSLMVSLGTLGAGAVGVGNIMLITVKERSKELGIRKALGASPLRVIRMVLTEAVILTLFPGYLGLLSGTVLWEIIASLIAGEGGSSEFFSNPEVDFQLAIICLIALITAGGLAGLYPAYQAARLRPVIALKTE